MLPWTDWFLSQWLWLWDGWMTSQVTDLLNDQRPGGGATDSGARVFSPSQPVVFCQKALSCLVALLPSSPAYSKDVGADVYNGHKHFPDPWSIYCSFPFSFTGVRPHHSVSLPSSLQHSSHPCSCSETCLGPRSKFSHYSHDLQRENRKLFHQIHRRRDRSDSPLYLFL